MESRWITGLIILVVIFIIGLCITNAVVYSKIASENKTVGDVSPGGARALMVINILLAVVFLFIFVWYCFKFYRNGEEIYLKNYLKKAGIYAGDKYKNWRGTNNSQGGQGVKKSGNPFGTSEPIEIEMSSPRVQNSRFDTNMTIGEAMGNERIMSQICQM